MATTDHLVLGAYESSSHVEMFLKVTKAAINYIGIVYIIILVILVCAIYVMLQSIIHAND